MVVLVPRSSVRIKFLLTKSPQISSQINSKMTVYFVFSWVWLDGGFFFLIIFVEWPWLNTHMWGKFFFSWKEREGAVGATADVVDEPYVAQLRKSRPMISDSLPNDSPSLRRSWSREVTYQRLLFCEVIWGICSQMTSHNFEALASRALIKHLAR